jgi:hypothetical protein
MARGTVPPSLLLPSRSCVRKLAAAMALGKVPDKLHTQSQARQARNVLTPALLQATAFNRCMHHPSLSAKEQCTLMGFGSGACRTVDTVDMPLPGAVRLLHLLFVSSSAMSDGRSHNPNGIVPLNAL